MKLIVTIGLLILAANALVVLMVGLVMLTDWFRQRAWRSRAIQEQAVDESSLEEESGDEHGMQGGSADR